MSDIKKTSQNIDDVSISDLTLGDLKSVIADVIEAKLKPFVTKIETAITEESGPMRKQIFSLITAVKKDVEKKRAEMQTAVTRRELAAAEQNKAAAQQHRRDLAGSATINKWTDFAREYPDDCSVIVEEACPIKTTGGEFVWDDESDNTDNIDRFIDFVESNAKDPSLSEVLTNLESIRKNHNDKIQRLATLHSVDEDSLNAESRLDNRKKAKKKSKTKTKTKTKSNCDDDDSIDPPTNNVAPVVTNNVDTSTTSENSTKPKKTSIRRRRRV